jgi:hypothetical protein
MHTRLAGCSGQSCGVSSIELENSSKYDCTSLRYTELQHGSPRADKILRQASNNNGFHPAFDQISRDFNISLDSRKHNTMLISM